MDRVIRFRAWSPCEKKMWMDVGVDGYGGIILDTDNMGLQPLKQWLPDGKAVLMQFTGLVDKNGKEIYEGDIVAFEEYSDFMKAWIKTRRLPVVYFGDKFCGKTDDHIHSLTFLPNHIVVIGNLYENPELQEGK